MNAYMATDGAIAAFTATTLLLVLVAGHFVVRIPSARLVRSTAWLIVILGVGGMEQATLSQPPGFRMLAIIGILLFTMKIVVAAEVRQSGRATLSFWQWMGFAGCWPGMRPTLFASVPSEARDEVARSFWRGVINMVLGAALLLAARGTWDATSDVEHSLRLLLTTVLLLPGISLVLHFGIFNLLTAAWRWMGADCNTLFRAPVLSKSLTEFWGKRWNLGFSEMTTLAVYRPLRSAWGTTRATLTAFLFSGVLHELAISVPVRAGFGRPLLYFALHGIGMLLETRWKKLAELIRTRPALGRVWTLAWIMIPLPILFHEPFLRGCVWPLIGIEL